MAEKYTVPPPGVPASKVYTPAELARFDAARNAKEAKMKRKDAVKKRWAMLNHFVDYGMAGLELSDMAVWMTLFRHANADGVACVPQTRIKTLTGIAGSTITLAIERLLKTGWVERIQRGGPVGGPAKYCLIIPVSHVPMTLSKSTDERCA